jgi:tricarballylate dehydrogenase
MMELADSYEVVVAGGGNAALCAAITAARAGRSVVVLEAAPAFYRGGNTRHTRNLRCAQDGRFPTMTGTYSEEEYMADLLRVTAGETNETLARMLIAGSGDLTVWLGEQGVRFQPPLSGTLGLGRTNAFFLGGGRAELNSLYRTAERLGVLVMYEAPVTGLRIENGVFAAATVRVGDKPREVRGRTLVAAAGGFEANVDWLKQYWGEAAENFHVRGTHFNRGDVLRQLLEAGAAPVGDPTQIHAVAVDARSPKFDGGIATRLDCIVFGIVVDRDGARFYDEGEDFWPKRYAIWGRLIAQLPDQIAFGVIDAKSIDRFIPSLYPPIKADTISELAAALGLGPDGLERTVADFNAAVRPGTLDHTILDDCRTEGLNIPKTHWASAIDTPPYYGYPLRPGITFTYLGVQVDERARVMKADGSPFENITAAGEIMAGNVLGKGYLAGAGMTIGGVFGRIAGEEAARHA